MEPFSHDRAAAPWPFRAHVGSCVLGLVLGFAGTARAEEGTPNGARRVGSAQLGMAFVAEGVPDAGSVCPDDATAPCILRAGGGVGIRIGYRTPGPWFVGGVYEFTRHESSSLLRLAILQQFRAEGRYYFDAGNRTTPFLAGGLGFHLYGSEWTADTGGLVASLGGGVALELTPRTVIGFMASYRVLLPRTWTDAAGQERADGPLGFGIAHLIGLELTFEIRDPVPHW
ncbi:MAG TPA: hypothetical protein VGK73_28600 [Polyangiaceae bacterium]